MRARLFTLFSLWLMAAVAWWAAPAQAFDLQGHRGARGLAPENTIAAFERAIALGVTTLELDLALTKDGHLIVTHDPAPNQAIARGPDGQWVSADVKPIHAMSLAEVRTLDVGRLKPGSPYALQWPEQTPVDGQRMPTFDEVANLVKRTPRPLRLNIETKLSPLKPDETATPEAFVSAVVAALDRHGLQAVTTVQSFDWRTLRALKAKAPAIEAVCLTTETERTNNLRPAQGQPSWTADLRLGDHGNSVPKLVKAAGCSTWSPFWRNVTADGLAEARAAGLKTIPWTVNDPAEMARLIDLGVEGLITDYPDRAQIVLKAKGRAVQ